MKANHFQSQLVYNFGLNVGFNVTDVWLSATFEGLNVAECLSNQEIKENQGKIKEIDCG